MPTGGPAAVRLSWLRVISTSSETAWWPDFAGLRNAGREAAGAYHPRHRHDFAQVWHSLEGTFKIGERTVGPGTVVFHADPYYEEDMSTETGGLIFFVQYTGPHTGKGPIYDGRFNMKERKPLSDENLKV